MSILYERLKEGGYTRPRGKFWTCPKCGTKNLNRKIDPRSNEIQRCSHCGNPKPMLMGFWVCEYCKRGPKVSLIPSFVRECPDCGQPRLDATRVYPPVTDEAMKEGIHQKYSSLTWECKCGHKNAYPYGTCLKCGLSIDKVMNADAADVDDPEKKAMEVAKKMRRSNWKCPYCGRTNRGIDKICAGCGNSEKSEEDDIITIRRNHSSNETTGPSQVSNQEAHRKKVFTFHSDIWEQGKSFLGGTISFAKKLWWGIPILFIILLIMVSIKEEEYVISDMKYESTFYIEKFTTTHHSGELSYPAGAYNIKETQESRFVPDQDDDDWDNDNDTWNNDTGGGDTWNNDTWGNDTWNNNTWDNDTWGSDTWDNDTWGGDTWGNDTWDNDTWGSDTWDNDTWGSDDWNDYGGDYFDNILHIIHKLKEKIKNSAKNALTKVEYYTVYSYDIDEWIYSRTIDYNAKKGEKVKSPEAELAENERISFSVTKYIIYLQNEKEKIYTLTVSEEDFLNYRIGDKIKVKTLFGHPLK